MLFKKINKEYEQFAWSKIEWLMWSTVANQRPLSNGVTFQTACIHSYDCEPVKGSWLRSQINCGLGTVDRLCAVSMGLVCTHTSGSSEWKAYVSGRQWLNDTTYRPNSHSGSCTYFEKITRTEILQTENHLCQSDRRCLTCFDPSSGLKLNFVDALVQRASFGNVAH